MTKGQAVCGAVGAGVGVASLAALMARRGQLAPAAALLAAGSMAAWAAFSPAHPAFGPVLRRGPRDRPRAALTFDDGPGPSTPAVLDALAEGGAQATFFVLGRQARRHPDLVARIRREGHQLASHGDDHGILVFRGPAHVAGQLRRTEAAVAAATGDPAALSRLFRAPHGFRGPLTTAAARSCGYRVVGWTSGVFDSADPGVDVIAARVAAALGPGAIILLHDADGWAPERPRDQTAAALPAVCRAAAAAGVELVTLRELAGAG